VADMSREAGQKDEIAAIKRCEDKHSITGTREQKKEYLGEDKESKKALLWRKQEEMRS